MTFERLKGIRVLNLTNVVVGPVGTWRLGQYGAKIDSRQPESSTLLRGAPTRAERPYLISEPPCVSTSISEGTSPRESMR
jgi:crotonobetainyl-CoA:carnitine CoA-transferase CaiB-like acyl-CoA transferase